MGAAGRGIVWIASLGVAAALGVAGTLLLRAQGETPPPPLLSLDEMGHLATVKVNVADIVEFTENRTLDIPWSSWQLKYAGTRVLLIVKGDCLVGTDLRAGRYESVDAAGRSVTLVLAPPETLQARVNHSPAEQGGSRLYSMSNQGIEALIPGSATRTRAIDAAMRIAQQRVEEACANPEVSRSAKQNAEGLLQTSLSALGWTARVEWDQPTGRASPRTPRAALR